MSTTNENKKLFDEKSTIEVHMHNNVCMYVTINMDLWIANKKYVDSNNIPPKKRKIRHTQQIFKQFFNNKKFTI